LPVKPPRADIGNSNEKARGMPPQAKQPAQEERKRGGWGNNGPRSNSNAGKTPS